MLKIINTKLLQYCLTFLFSSVASIHFASAAEYCETMKQSLESCRNSAAQLPELSKVCDDIQKAMGNECSSPTANSASSPGKVKPMKLERDTCDAMALKCGQDASSADCHAFQKSVQNNGYRCHLFGDSVRRSGASQPSPKSAQSVSACVSDFLSGTKEHPIINIANRCTQPIKWSMCINVKDRVARDYPSGVTAPGSKSEYRLLLQPGQSYIYRYSVCGGDSCQTASPSC